MKQREGVVVNPYKRLSDKQIEIVDSVSRTVLEESGLVCFNAEAAEAYRNAGAKVSEEQGQLTVRLPSAVVDKALSTAPSRIVLGARDPDNRLVLDAHEPRIRFGSGAETNVWLDVSYENGRPKFSREEGSIARLLKAAHLGENLENLDFFIRCVNIRDKAVTEQNKDVNKFLASLRSITKHVQAGLTDLNALDDVVKMAEIIAGGKDAFERNPVVSFITCVVKSPLQIVEDTAAKFLEISKRRLPVVISSSPMGGATAPFDEFGMVSLINAELLAGVTLNQIVSPGSPILYGAVPVRTRLDNLNDMYGAPEFNQYNIDCAQMARHYGLPCYSTAGVGDASVPGIQATAEKVSTLAGVPRSGAQYIHYAFGLLERTNVFCPEQAIMDDAHIRFVKYALRQPEIDEVKAADTRALISQVMESDHRTFVYNLPLPTQDDVYMRYPLESDDGDALYAAHNRFKEILRKPVKEIDQDVLENIRLEVPGILPETLAEWQA